MFGKKNKLARDFAALLETRSILELKALFDRYDVNARGGYSNQTAIAYSECPDELTRWLVGQGADINATDDYGSTPLHARARHWKGRVEVLLDLGADPNHGDGSRGTPLHAAARSFKPEAARTLISRGARVDALNEMHETPLEDALHVCRNIDIEHAAELADLLLAAGARQTSKTKEYVARIGTEFEFHRAAFSPEILKATSAGLNRLYALFGVPPIPCRLMHDCKSPITVPNGNWEDQHRALWDLLVPSSGMAVTVQGEIIRISGRIHRELYHEGGVNWDDQYRQMAKALLAHIASGNSLPQTQLDEAARLVAELKRRGEAFRLSELAVAWVAINPAPVDLPKPAYER